MKLFAHNPRQFTNSDIKVPQSLRTRHNLCKWNEDEGIRNFVVQQSKLTKVHVET